MLFSLWNRGLLVCQVGVNYIRRQSFLTGRSARSIARAVGRRGHCRPAPAQPAGPAMNGRSSPALAAGEED